jgi:hypothetical protein
MPGAAFAQKEIVVWVESQRVSASGVHEIVVTKLTDSASAGFFRSRIMRGLIAANISSFTPADVEALAAAAAGKAGEWYKTYLVSGNCGNSPIARGTAPSGSFHYTLECR